MQTEDQTYLARTYEDVQCLITAAENNIRSLKGSILEQQQIIANLKLELKTAPHKFKTTTPNKTTTPGEKRPVGRPRMNPEDRAPTTKAAYARQEKQSAPKPSKVVAWVAAMNAQDPNDEKAASLLLNYLKTHTKEEALEYFNKDMLGRMLKSRQIAVNQAIINKWDEYSPEEVEEWKAQRNYHTGVVTYFNSILGTETNPNPIALNFDDALPAPTTDWQGNPIQPAIQTAAPQTMEPQND